MKTIFRNPVILFLIISAVITLVVYLWMFLLGDNNASITIMMWTPAIAAGLSSLILKIKLSPFGWNPGIMKYKVYT